VSTSLPPAVLRRALIASTPAGARVVDLSDPDLRRVAGALQEEGYVIVARRDVHALRAAADRVLRFTPEGGT